LAESAVVCPSQEQRRVAFGYSGFFFLPQATPPGNQFFTTAICHDVFILRI
jgi:hypothetical protein